MIYVITLIVTVLLACLFIGLGILLPNTHDRPRTFFLPLMLILAAIVIGLGCFVGDGVPGLQKKYLGRGVNKCALIVCERGVCGSFSKYRWLLMPKED